MFKKCVKCLLDKEVGDFLPRLRNGHNHTFDSYCRSCRKQIRKNWGIENKEHISIEGKKYYLENRDSIIKRTKIYRDSNKDREYMRHSNYRATHRKEMLERESNWRKANPEKRSAAKRNRRARINNSIGIHSSQDIKILLIKQNNKCAACKTRLIKYHVDHVVPIINGGSNWPENLQILCPTCNVSKGTRDQIIFMQSRGFLI